MNRADFQQLADVRIEEAAALLAAQKWDGAYYLAGYAVECALKACIAKRTNQYDFPDRRFAEKCFTHDFDRLLECADLDTLLKTDMSADQLLSDHWEIVILWDEATRYARKSQAEAEMLYNAITDQAHGVLSWLKRGW
jgi:hypothetical protein